MIKTEDGWGPSLQTREIRQEDIVLNDLEIKGGGAVTGIIGQLGNF